MAARGGEYELSAAGAVDPDRRRERLAVGGRVLNLFEREPAGDNPAEGGKALAVGVAAAGEVEFGLIAHTDKELIARGVGADARHAERAMEMAQSGDGGSFEFDRVVRGGVGAAAALDNADADFVVGLIVTMDNAMELASIVGTGVDVAEKIGRSARRGGGVDLGDERAERGFQSHFGKRGSLGKRVRRAFRRLRGKKTVKIGQFLHLSSLQRRSECLMIGTAQNIFTTKRFRRPARKFSLVRSLNMAAARMTQTQLVKALADAVEGSSSKQVKALLAAYSDIAIKETKKNGVFVLPGLGRLVRQERKARMGRNPATGAAIKIPAKKVVKFRVAKAVKDAIVPPKKK